MARNTACTVFIGNLDEKVSERVLYEILIQVGRVVDLHIPRDKETNRHKGYAFAEYETEEIAGYAVRLFSGLVRLHNKTLRFAMSGQDKSSQNAGTTVTPKTIPPLPKNYSTHAQDTEMSQESSWPVINGKIAYGNSVVSPVYPQASTDGLVSRGLSNGSFEYSRRVFGAMLSNVSHPGSRQSFAYPSY